YSVVCKRAFGRGQNGETGCRQFLVRPAQALHILVGPDRWLFSRTFVLRSGPIAGTTVSRRRLAQREPSWIALQCRSQSADAILHSAARGDCFHVLPIRKAARLFQSTCVRARTGERLCTAISCVTDAVRGGVHAKARSGSRSFQCVIGRARSGDAQAARTRRPDARLARSNQGRSGASGRGSKEQGIGLRVHYFYSSTDAARNCRITDRSDLVRDHVGDGSNSERSGFHYGDRFLSAVDSPNRERPSLCGGGESTDSRVGFGCHRDRFVCQFGRESD